ncbi:MAG: phenylacetate--CoA ligase [Gammaproteobacteria bacterium]|nr:phenylacetate--CoA ligase [Gammaproteobacteria bacterium]
MSQKFWNPEIETLDRNQVRALEAPLIADQIRYVYRHSPYYRDKYDRAGIDPASIDSHQALATLPFTEKADIALAQQQGALLGPNQCCDFEDIVRMTCTGGSTGEPTRLGWSQNDIEVYDEMGARALWTMGCRPRDLVISCFNYSMYAGGIMDHGGFEAMGACILAYGIGNSERLLEMISRFPARETGYSIYLTPSYAVRLADIAAGLGIDLAALGVTRGFFSGEAGLQVPGYRDKIEQAWGMHAMDMYGTAELGVHSGECEHRSGLHYSCAGLVAVELIDPDSGEVKAFEDESEGELVFTTLRREACPLVRLRSHDIVRIYTEACACGRKSFRLHTLGRSDDMFIVKGINVFPLGIQEALLNYLPDISAEFFVELSQPPPIDYPPRICLEVDTRVDAAAYSQLVVEIRSSIKRHCNFTPTIELVAQGSIASEHKTRRLYRSYLGAQAPALEILYRGC